MRRLGLSVLLVLSLAACGPMVSTQPQPPDTDTATLRIAPEPSGVIFFAGSADALNLKLTISGADLRANAPPTARPSIHRSSAPWRASQRTKV